MMETQAVEGSIRLLEYGVLGIVLLLALGVIVYLQKQHKETISLVISDKDKQIESWKLSTEKRDDMLDGVLSQLTNNSTRIIDLYEHQQRSIDAIPDRTVEKLRLSSFK